ncbi:MAG: tyrosine-type recombinase/integrase [Saprospiraceae bacterium]|nr:tyrosine-type recombinase/integrase [Saprospiraceae bacterium]
MKSKITDYLLQTYLKCQNPEIPIIWSLISTNQKDLNSFKPGLLYLFRLLLDHSEKLLLVGQYSGSTLKKMKVIYGHVAGYIKFKYQVLDLSLQKLKLKHLLEFEEYLIIEKKNNETSTNKIIQRIRSVIKYAIAMDFMDKDPWMLYKPKHVELEIKYITQKQLHLLKSVNIPEIKLQRVRDLFIFSCYTGLAYSELQSVSIEHIDINNGITWIALKRQKTKKIQKTPMLGPAFEIWNKYGETLPKISNQKYNDYLKELSDLIKLPFPLTSHLGRKTFTTTILIGNNVPLKITSQLLAHSNSVVTEKYYAAVSNELLENEIIKLSKLL